MRTTVVDENAKLMVTNGIVQVIGVMSSSRSIHAWLKAHMEDHPGDRHELIIGNKVVIELGAGDASRADLTQRIIDQFDRERMNFGESVRLRLIAVSSIEQTIPEPAQVIAEPETNDGLPTEEEMWIVTRLPQSELELIVEQSLTQETWRVVIAYSELQRRNRSLDPKLIDGLYQLARAKGFSHNGEIIEDLFKQLNVPHFGALLDKLSRFSRHNDAAQLGSATIADKRGATGVTNENSGSRPISSKGVWYKKWYVWVAILFLAGIVGNISEKSHGDDSTNMNKSERVSFSQAKSFMDQRCRDLGHTLIDSKESPAFEQGIVYFFLTEAPDGSLCVSGISEYQLEIMAADCGSRDVKLSQWLQLR